MQKNKFVVISILTALLVSGALSVAAAQETPQVPPTQPNYIPPTPTIQSNGPVEGEHYVPGVGTATITGPDGVTTTITNVTLPAPIYQTDDGVPAFDANGNGQATTGQNGDVAQEPGAGEVVPIYAVYENPTDNAATITAVGLVVAALAMGAVGIVCLGKHP